MSEFLTELDMYPLTSSDGVSLKSLAGKQQYRLSKPFVYYSDLLKCEIVIPIGFTTDLDSIPRLPLIYLLLNDNASRPGVLHDYLYFTGLVSREIADLILKEACYVIGLPQWQTELIYIGVRAGGFNHYLQNTQV